MFHHIIQYILCSCVFLFIMSTIQKTRKSQQSAKNNAHITQPNDHPKKSHLKYTNKIIAIAQKQALQIDHLSNQQPISSEIHQIHTPQAINQQLHPQNTQTNIQSNSQNTPQSIPQQQHIQSNLFTYFQPIHQDSSQSNYQLQQPTINFKRKSTNPLDTEVIKMVIENDRQAKEKKKKAKKIRARRNMNETEFETQKRIRRNELKRLKRGIFNQIHMARHQILERERMLAEQNYTEKRKYLYGGQVKVDENGEKSKTLEKQKQAENELLIKQQMELIKQEVINKNYSISTIMQCKEIIKKEMEQEIIQCNQKDQVKQEQNLNMKQNNIFPEIVQSKSQNKISFQPYQKKSSFSDIQSNSQQSLSNIHLNIQEESKLSSLLPHDQEDKTVFDPNYNNNTKNDSLYQKQIQKDNVSNSSANSKDEIQSTSDKGQESIQNLGDKVLNLKPEQVQCKIIHKILKTQIIYNKDNLQKSKSLIEILKNQQQVQKESQDLKDGVNIFSLLQGKYMMITKSRMFQ